jgi:hypothetical protein
MALARWRMIRDTIIGKKSGTLIIQMGRHYIHFVIEEGNLAFVSSTLPEFSFSYFLIQSLEIDSKLVLQAQSQISDGRSLGAVLVQNYKLPSDQICQLLRKHWLNLTHYMMQPTAHAFWSSRVLKQKDQMINADLPLSQVLLMCERNSIEIQSALRFLENMPERCKVIDLEPVEEVLHGVERRILPYLRAGTKLDDILKDPELDRMTCYKILFQLWLSGYLQDGQRKRSTDRIIKSHPLFERVRSLPPDWVIPFAVGALIGVLLAPNPAPSSPPLENPPKVDKTWDPPAWQSDKDKGDEGIRGDRDDG